MNNEPKSKCEHKESTGNWKVEQGVSTAECKGCGKWYKTSLFENTISSPTQSVEEEYNYWNCNGCDKCGGWASNPDVEKACINNSCDCHKKNTKPGSEECGFDCHWQQPYGFVPEAGCKIHDVSPTQSVEEITTDTRKIGMLRQWLNEDKITDVHKMVTNEDLLYWLSNGEEK